MTYWGWDYAWWRPTAAQLKSNGVQFVCRYLSYDNTGKNLTKSEANFLKANGVAIVSNWEFATDAAKNGYNQGVKDAKEAARQHTACGGPSNAPIYFSADWDVTSGQQPAVNSYLDGCASVIGKARVGVYGSYYCVKRAMEGGHATWGWCTYAWSGGNIYSKAHIYQYQNGVMSGNADRNRSLQDNYGQWSQNGAEMPLNQVDLNNIFKAVWQKDALPVPTKSLKNDPDNKAWWAQSLLTEGINRTDALTDKVDALAEKVKDVTTTQVVLDAPAVARELAANDTFIQKLADALVARNK